MSRHAASRHAARADRETRARTEYLIAVVLASGVLAAAALVWPQGRTGIAILVGVLQGLLVVGWVVAIALPGRIGAMLIGAATAGAADAALLLPEHPSLSAVVGVLGLTVPAMIVHQLSRGVVRVRVTESMSDISLLCAGVAGLAGYLALTRAPDGPRVAAATLVAAAAAVLVNHLVDAVLPVPRFTEDVPKGILAVVLAGLAGAAAGAVQARGWAELDLPGGVLLGGLVGLAAALVAVGVGYIAQTVQPAGVRFGGLAMPYVRVALPIAFAAPVAYLVGLSVAG